MKRIAIVLILILVLSNIPFTGTSIRVNKSLNSDEVIDQYIFDSLYCKSKSEITNLNSEEEINDPNNK